MLNMHMVYKLQGNTKVIVALFDNHPRAERYVKDMKFWDDTGYHIELVKVDIHLQDA